MTALVGLATSAHAAIVTFDHNFEFSGGSQPSGAAPWLRATFDDGGGSGSVTLTFTALNLVDQEFARFTYFNLDPAISPAGLSFSAPTKVGTFTDPTVETGTNAFQADGDGLYDIRISFDNAPPGNRFGPGEAVTYTITAPGLTANSFNFLSAPAGGSGPFPTAAHVQGIGSSGQFSGWTTHVPEPASLGVAALGAVVGLRRRRR
jgi:MYXO-CTERM domain-containing protein